MSLLAVDKLNVQFDTSEGVVHAVRDLSLSISEGQSLAIVGESGSGKSQMAFAILGLLASNGMSSGSVLFNGEEILGAPLAKLNKVRATGIGMVFQDAMASLNPYMRVSEQMSEVLIYHFGVSRTDAIKESIQLLDAVRIPDAANRINRFPHEFSGGMQQRVMIAMALLCKPSLLIADEPTTALDVTVQADVIALLGDLQRDMDMSVMLITHDLGVVAGFSDEVLVMYSGQLMEHAPVHALFENPTHPYTRGLLASTLSPDSDGTKLNAIAGSPPNLMLKTPGCPFAPRCADNVDACATTMPNVTRCGADHLRACHVDIESLQ